jgi:saccharopine dehydrogenase (NAD+, L-lysine-forming)
MMAACIRTGVVYIDISGEWPVFVEAQELSLAAARAGVMLAPGMGFTVAASDCLLALAAQAAPQAVKLRLAVSRPSAVTRGSIRSLAALLEPRVIVRRQSHLTDVAVGTLNHNVDFGGGFRPTTAVSWADVATAEFTTGIGDIETYAEAGWMRRLAHRVSAASTRLTGGRAHPLLRESFTLAWPPHPPFRQPHGGMILVAEAIDRWRRVTRLRMRTADGYAVTEAVISAAIQRILRGDYAVGFRTPASLWTGEFILGLGCAALDGQDSLAMAM